LEFQISDSEMFFKYADSILVEQADMQALLITHIQSRDSNITPVLSLPAIRVLGTHLQNNRDLVYLRINGQRLNMDKAQVLVEALQNNDKLREIDLFNNDLTNGIAMYIVQALQSLPALRKLNLGGNNIDAEGRDALDETQQTCKFKIAK